MLNAGAAQTLSVTFTPTDAANYTDGDDDDDDQRAEGDAARSRWSTPADITYGTALSATQLNATASVPGTFVYTPVAGHRAERRCRPDAVGDLHADRRGELHDGDEDDLDQRAEGDAARSRGRAPADITYGTALSATQLNATANVPGTFVYTPVAGTVLNAGAARRCR